MPAAQVTDAPTQADPPPDQPADESSCSGQLLGLLRRLIAHGHRLADRLCQRTVPDYYTATGFGSLDLALILRRIMLGLQRAVMLEAHITKIAERLDRASEPAPRAPTPASCRTPRQSAQPADPAAAPDPTLARMPSIEEIAADIRRRPIGAVLADICRDLGIMPNEPMWLELNLAILSNGGNSDKLLLEMMDRPSTVDSSSLVVDDADMPPWLARSAPQREAAAATGPP
jgi:hypothetical protein